MDTRKEKIMQILSENGVYYGVTELIANQIIEYLESTLDEEAVENDKFYWAI